MKHQSPQRTALRLRLKQRRDESAATYYSRKELLNILSTTRLAGRNILRAPISLRVQAPLPGVEHVFSGLLIAIDNVEAGAVVPSRQVERASQPVGHGLQQKNSAPQGTDAQKMPRLHVLALSQARGHLALCIPHAC